MTKLVLKGDTILTVDLSCNVEERIEGGLSHNEAVAITLECAAAGTDELPDVARVEG